MARLIWLTVGAVTALAVAASASQAERPSPPKLRITTGVVGAISSTSIVVGAGGKATMFDLTSSTRLIGKGAGPHDLVLRDPRARIADFVKVGDKVTVTYRKAGDGLLAVELRVTPPAP